MLVRPKHARLAQRRFLHQFADDLTPPARGHNWARRRETQRAARVYFNGLLQPVQVKSMERLAASGGIPSHRLQQFITDSPWDADHLLESLTTRMGGLPSPEGIVVFDDTGQAKQGRHSVGVGRQYSGTLGRIGNCQVAVTAIYVVPGKGHNADAISWPLGMDLYLPKDWTENPARREAVGIPEGIAYRTKPEIALEILDRVRAQRVPHRAIVVDAGYGDVDPFRQELRRLHEPYAAAWAPANHRTILVEDSRPLAEGRLPSGTEEWSPARLATSLPAEAWREIEWSEGTKGQLRAEFVRRRVRVTHQSTVSHGTRVLTDEEGWLVLERTPDELKAWIVWGLDDRELDEQVLVIHNRWAIEQYHREIKQILGMDRFEGRTWRGWHHHMAMICLAYAFLAQLRAERAGGRKLPPFNAIHWSVVYALIRFEVLKDQGLTKAQSKEIALRMMVRVLGLRQPPE
ncbi:MAG: IS701 family transposase [Thermoplasmata archaeon]|nr:IS701 family transposase [Thermoplasmata archaeon]